MKAGAVDFLTKPFQDDDLLLAVQQAIALDEHRHAEQAERQEVGRLFDTLTPREREVMALVVRGLPNKRIATELGTSEKTIKIHRGRVMEKMQARVRRRFGPCFPEARHRARVADATAIVTPHVCPVCSAACDG